MRRRTAGSRASAQSIHKPARSLRRFASLLSTFSLLAGVAAKTSRSIKPRERDLRDLRLFVLARFFTRPTNHPRHAACASNDESKPVRPHHSNIPSNAFPASRCHTKSDTKISERFLLTGFNGVMQRLAYVGPDAPIASFSNMVGPLRQNRLASSELFLGAVCLIITAALGYIDYVTGYEQTFLLFYLVPISIATWFGRF